MKTAMAMLALALGLSFGSATFVQADEMMKKDAAPAAPTAATAPAAPAAAAGEVKKDEGKKKGKGHKKAKGAAKKDEAPKP